MNGRVAGIRASEARVSHRVGGKRTPLGRLPALNILATRKDPYGFQCMAARPQFPVRRSDETGVTAQSVQCRNGKEVKENALL
jgi:hypothetical protein